MWGCLKSKEQFKEMLPEYKYIYLGWDGSGKLNMREGTSISFYAGLWMVIEESSNEVLEHCEHFSQLKDRSAWYV